MTRPDIVHASVYLDSETHGRLKELCERLQIKLSTALRNGAEMAIADMETRLEAMEIGLAELERRSK